MTTLLSATYLGPIEHYAHIYHDDVLLEQWEHYNRQTYANRCCILTSNGVMSLTIPVEKADPHTPIHDIRISTHTDWQSLHWKAIESAYRTSPFFEYYQDDLHPLYTQEWNYLIDFNIAAQNIVLDILELRPPSPTHEYRTTWDNATDLRGLIHPKHPSSPISRYNETPYYQVFQNKYGFTSNLSIIDLLFNMGNEARLVLKQSIKQ